MALDFFAYGISFLFVFAVVYGSLEVSGIFSRRITALIAVILGFFILGSESVVLLIWQVLPYAALFFVAFFFIGFVISFAKKGMEGDWTLGVIAAGLVLMVFATQAEHISELFPSLGGGLPADLMILAAALLIIVILYGAYKAGKGQ